MPYSLVRRTIAENSCTPSKHQNRHFLTEISIEALTMMCGPLEFDGFAHYMSYGWREGRNPSRGFNTLYYRDRHLDGAEENPLSHYVWSCSISSGLAPSAPSEEDFVKLQRTLVIDVFYCGYYECQVTDVSQDLLTHYLTVGWREGLSPSPAFDVKQYYSEHSYIKNVWAPALCTISCLSVACLVAERPRLSL